MIMPLRCADGATQGHFHGPGPLRALRPPGSAAVWVRSLSEAVQ